MTTSHAGGKPGRSAARQLADEVLETYVRWREQSAAVRSAYERWRDAPAEDRALTFAAYQAAVDLEEQAARTLRERAVRGAAVA